MTMKYLFKRSTLSLAVVTALSGLLVGCFNNSDSTESSDAALEGDAYYASVAKQYLSKMSLSEKIRVVVGNGLGATGLYTPDNLIRPVTGAVGAINGVLNEQLNLPAVQLSDGPAGIKNGHFYTNGHYATAFPIGTQLASTWNVELVKEVAEAMGNETKEFGSDFLLSPGMNIQRNPLAGRNFEYFSEDPLITGKMGAAIVNGLKAENVGATIKHFFGNESETNRLYVDSIATPRSLREIYLKGFRIAIDESEPWSMMTGYNKVNGAYVGHRKDAMTSILRDEWGFKGFAMTDWGADDVFDDPDSAANLMKAGNDLVMPGGEDVQDFLQASVDSGDITEAEIDKNVLKILTQAQKTLAYSDYEWSGEPDSERSREVARRAGAEGMVLVKNNSALPIRNNQKVAMFGVAQYATYKGGTGSGNVLSEYTVDIATGLSERFVVNDDLMSRYQTYFEENKTDVYDSWGPLAYYDIDEAAVTDVIDNTDLQTLLTASAVEDDVAVISISRQAGEGADREAVAGDYYLTAEEMDMISNVSAAFKAQDKKVVVVLNINGVVDTSQWEDNVDAILVAYMGGQEMGYEVADLLSGDVNPSGKLAQTFPASYESVPNSDTFPGIDEDNDGLVDKIYFNEGVYVGYRYYTSKNVEVSYPFGHGLSYTTFTIDSTAIGNNDLSSGYNGKLTLTAKVTNTGDVTGKEVAQVYINAPEVKLKKPTIELKAFAKTAELAAGSSETLTFNISAFELASFSPDDNAWIIEPGQYNVYVANSSDIANVTPVTFTIASEIVVAETTPGALALTTDFVPDVIE